MSNIRLRRDHKAAVHLEVGGQYAIGAEFNGMSMFNGKQCAVFLVPLDHVTFAEVDNVVPFVRAS